MGDSKRPLAKNIGVEIRRLRTEKGWSQAELAKAVGTSNTSISGIEVGRHKPRKSLIEKLALYFRYPTLVEVYRNPELTDTPQEISSLSDKGSDADQKLVLEVIERLLQSGELTPVDLLLAIIDYSRLTKSESTVIAPNGVPRSIEEILKGVHPESLKRH